MAAYAAGQPHRGWGQFIGLRTDPGTTVINAARCGASTRTFIADGHWERVLPLRPAWVLIQFGHNDSHAPGRPESTTADDDYAANLGRMVDGARAAGAHVVLITPVRRRTWAADGTLTDLLAPYAAAMRRVAAAHAVALVDLHQRSGEAYLRMGRTGTDAWSPVPDDFSHFDADGARTVAMWVADALPASYPHGSGSGDAPPAEATDGPPEGY